MISFPDAIKALRQRQEWLEQKIVNNPYFGLTKRELAGIKLAIKCMELVRSYGYVAVTDYGPLLHRQKDNPKERYGKS